MTGHAPTHRGADPRMRSHGAADLPRSTLRTGTPRRARKSTASPCVAPEPPHIPLCCQVVATDRCPRRPEFPIIEGGRAACCGDLYDRCGLDFDVAASARAPKKQTFSSRKGRRPLPAASPAAAGSSVLPRRLQRLRASRCQRDRRGPAGCSDAKTRRPVGLWPR
jgi:hypothetical protein